MHAKKSIAILLMMTQSAMGAGRPKPQPSPEPSARPVYVSQCADVFKACDRALEAKNKLIDEYEEGRVESAKALSDRTVKLEQAREDLQSWYRNPFYMIGLGLLGGLILGPRLLK